MKCASIAVWTDGACSGNPGPGGYAAVVMTEAGNVAITGHSERTTNNRMELTAFIEGLSYVENNYELYPSTKIEVYTDSKYIENAINCGWIKNWEKKKFKNVKNLDLWLQAISLVKLLTPDVIWVKGHSGIPGNELVDKFATVARDSESENRLVISF